MASGARPTSDTKSDAFSFWRASLVRVWKGVAKRRMRSRAVLVTSLFVAVAVAAPAGARGRPPHARIAGTGAPAYVGEPVVLQARGSRCFPPPCRLAWTTRPLGSRGQP